MEVIYHIETGEELGTPGPIIEVVGEPEDGWYEWRISRQGHIERQTSERATAHR